MNRKLAFGIVMLTQLLKYKTNKSVAKLHWSLRQNKKGKRSYPTVHLPQHMAINGMLEGPQSPLLEDTVMEPSTTEAFRPSDPPRVVGDPHISS